LDVFKGEDRFDLNKYRLLSIQNISYRILTAILASRLQKIVLKYGMLAEQQGGFLKFRGTVWQALLASMGIEVAREENNEVWTAYIDIKKAYDCVNRELMWKILRKKGFSEKEVDIIKKLYEKEYTDIEIGGESTRIEMGRGLRQGCALSPLLFNLYIDGVIRERQNGGRGIKLGREKINVLAFADDLMIVAKKREDMEEEINKLEDSLNKVGMEIGGEDKSEIFKGGAPRGKKRKKKNMNVQQVKKETVTDKLITRVGTEIKINKDGLKGGRYLGFMIDTDGDEKMTVEKVSQIIDEKIIKLDRLVWMDTEEKVLVANVMVIQAVLYQLQIKGVNRTKIKNWNTKIRKWVKKNSMANLVAEEPLYNRKEIGGRGLKDIALEADTALITAWLDILNMSEEMNKWVYRIVKEFIRWNEEKGTIYVNEKEWNGGTRKKISGRREGIMKDLGDALKRMKASITWKGI